MQNILNSCISHSEVHEFFVIIYIRILLSKKYLETGEEFVIAAAGIIKNDKHFRCFGYFSCCLFPFPYILMLKNTRAATLVKGLLVLAVILFISKWLNLHLLPGFWKKV